MWTSDDHLKNKKAGDVDCSAYVFDLGIELGVIKKDGRDYMVDGLKSLGTKSEEVKIRLFNDSEVCTHIQEKILETIK